MGRKDFGAHHIKRFLVGGNTIGIENERVQPLHNIKHFRFTQATNYSSVQLLLTPSKGQQSMYEEGAGHSAGERSLDDRQDSSSGEMHNKIDNVYS